MNRIHLHDTAIVIMAGGIGERFWPVSNRTTPKQLLKLHGEKSLLEVSFERAVRLVGRENVYVVAGTGLKEAIERVLGGLAAGNYIGEPAARNTAACLALAACHLEAAGRAESVMGVLTADHVIEEGVRFDSALRAATGHARQSDDLVVIGIEASSADTAFGYLELGERIETDGDEGSEEEVHRVATFNEKPDRATAEAYLRQGGYLWNSGMFFWRVRTLLEAFEKLQPEMAAELKKLRESGGGGLEADVLAEVYGALHTVSIDEAILEKSSRVVAVVGRFGWEDVGSWDALGRVHGTDERGNCVIGPAIVLDSSDNIIYNDTSVSGGKGAPEIVVRGLKGFVIARTDNAILITPKSEAQDVKKIVQHLKRIGREDLL